MFLSLTRTLRLRLRVTDSFRQHLAELVLGLCGFSLRRPFGHGKHIGTAALELKSGPAPPSPGIADATALNDARRRDRSGSAPRGRGRLFRGIVTSRRQPSSMTWRADFAAAGALRLWPSRYHACYEIDLETHLTGAAACPRRVQGKDMGGAIPTWPTTAPARSSHPPVSEPIPPQPYLMVWPRAIAKANASIHRGRLRVKNGLLAVPRLTSGWPRKRPIGGPHRKDREGPNR
jgi:hypothetical protein